MADIAHQADATAATRKGAVLGDEIWRTWRSLVRLLPVWRMPYEWVFSPSIWSLMGVDITSGLLKNRSTRRAFEILAPLPPAEVRRIHAIAHLNHRRQEVVSRWLAIGFVTLPASAALTLSQLSPRTLAAVAAWDGFARWYLMLAYIAVVVALYLLGAWRARQLLTLVELALIQRGLPPGGGDAEIDTPLEAPLGS